MSLFSSKLGFFFMLRMTQLWTTVPPHSTCRLGELTLANWKLLRLRTPHASIWKGGAEIRHCFNLNHHVIFEFLEKDLIRHILWYLNGSSLQNRFDSLRNYKDIGLSLRRWVGKVGLIRLPTVGQLRVSDRSPSGGTDVRMSHAAAFLFSMTGQSC